MTATVQAAPPPIRASHGRDRRLLPLAARSRRAGLGFLWLVDAGLQAQPDLFGRRWWIDDLAQSVMGLPAPLAQSILGAVRLVADHALLFNSLFVAVQAALGAALIVGKFERIAIVVSIPWALGVWWIGEGLGALPTGFALFGAGAPGPVLYYPLLGLLAWPRRSVAATTGPGRPVTIPSVAGTAVWALLWLGGALLEVPLRFGPARVLEANIEESSVAHPRWLADIGGYSYHVVVAHPVLIPVSLGLSQAAIGLGVLHPRFRRLSLAFGGVVTALFWIALQDLGTIPAGDATDPGAAPLVILLALGLWRRRDDRIRPG